jgi:hypothetical protein
MAERGGHKFLITFHTEYAALRREALQKLLKAVAEKRGRNKNEALVGYFRALRRQSGPAPRLTGMLERFIAAPEEGAFRGIGDPEGEGNPGLLRTRRMAALTVRHQSGDRNMRLRIRLKEASKLSVKEAGSKIKR